jgi:signal transduction histidine kinase
MNTRNWSIRSKIIALVAVPLAALLALWIFATALTVGPAFNLLSAQTLLDNVAQPGEVLVAELQLERRLSVEFLSVRDGDGGALATHRITTDKAVSDFRREASSQSARDAASELLQGRIDQIFVALDGLSSQRGYIDRREVDAAGAQASYSSIIDFAFKMFTATATFNEPEIDREIRALTSIGQGREWLSQADSLLAGAQAAKAFTPVGLGQLVQTIGTQRFLYNDAVADLPESARLDYERLVAGDAFVRLRQMQDTIVTSSRAGSAPPVQSRMWQPAYESAVQQLRAYEAAATEDLAGRAAPLAIGILLRLALAGILGLTAVVVSVVVSVRVGRSLISRLSQLRAAALQLAGERLPSVVRRLQHGEAVDVDAEAPPLEYGADEIGQLGRAFTEVQRTAVQSAVDEANVRKGLNEVFLNIARRSQTLLHRQLALLDRMERRQADPQELEDLYNLDHLATRMRRHAEDLVILAGATPGRGWRNPVPVVDVVRGAISEVEDYKRIDVSAVETSSVIGRAVGDVIHLLAELLENAASFSPPHTRVLVAGQVVPNGYAIEIEDRGLGMSAEAIEDANRRLLEPPDFDPGDSARLGLFVVAQLAGRHGIRVQLRSSPYGGVTAVALVPGDLISSGRRAALPSGPSGPVGLSGPSGSWDRPTASIGAGPTPSGGTANGRPTTLADPVASFRPVIVPNVPDDHDADLLRSLDPDSPAAPFAAPAAPIPIPAPGPAPARIPAQSTGSFAGPVIEPTGPTVDGPPSDGLTVDGLAQRRRTRPRPEPPAAPSVAVTRPGVPDVDEDGLPRRVRQANLVAQLRKPTEEPAPEAPARSPEQVRALMSALQTGTARGRQAAGTTEEEAPLSPVDWFTDAPPGEGPAPGTSWADAATAGFPVTRPGGGPTVTAPDVARAPEAAPVREAAPVPDAVADSTDPADTVVHHGEIVSRPATDPDSTPPVWPTIPSIAVHGPSSAAHGPSTAVHGGEPTHSDKDA